jgi:tight adherence protein B
MAVVVFLISALFMFGIVVFALRPSSDQKAMDRRLAAVEARESGMGSAPEEAELYLKTSQRGQFAWLEDLFSGTTITRKIHLLLVQSDSTSAIGTELSKCGVVAAAVGLIAWFFTHNLVIAIPAAVVSSYVPIAMLSLKRSRRTANFNKALPDCIDIIARSLRAGHSLVAAIAIVAEQAAEPARTEFNEVYRKQNYGLPFRDALMQLLDRVPSQDLKVLVTGILVQKDTGGNLAEILDKILFVIKERMRIQGEIRIHTAQGRLTGWILCSLPIVMLAIINIVNPGYSKVLFTDPFGKKMLYAGVGMLIVGGVIIRKIVNGIEV